MAVEKKPLLTTCIVKPVLRGHL